MKIKRNLLLFIVFFGYFCQASDQSIVPVILTNTPVQMYSVVDVDDGLTTTLLAASATSLTFRVKWQPDFPIPCGWLEFLAKQDIEDENWHLLKCVIVKPEQGYQDFYFLIEEGSVLWHYTEGWRIPKIFFRLKAHDASDYVQSEMDKEIEREVRERMEAIERLPPEERAEAWRLWEASMRTEAEIKKNKLVSRLAYEHNQRLFAELDRLAEAGATEEEKNEVVSRLVAEFGQRLSDALARLDAEGAEGKATVAPPSWNHFWLYAGILLGVCGVVYFVRRKQKIRN